MTPALALEQITCTFAGTSSYTAVRDVSIEVSPGEFVAVVGPTGCGKSTLLNVAAGLLAPSAARPMGGVVLCLFRGGADTLLPVCPSYRSEEVR